MRNLTPISRVRYGQINLAPKSICKSSTSHGIQIVDGGSHVGPIRRIKGRWRQVRVSLKELTALNNDVPRRVVLGCGMRLNVVPIADLGQKVVVFSPCDTAFAYDQFCRAAPSSCGVIDGRVRGTTMLRGTCARRHLIHPPRIVRGRGEVAGPALACNGVIETGQRIVVAPVNGRRIRSILDRAKKRTVVRLYDISGLVGIGTGGGSSVYRLCDHVSPRIDRIERIDFGGLKVNEKLVERSIVTDRVPLICFSARPI